MKTLLTDQSVGLAVQRQIRQYMADISKTKDCNSLEVSCRWS